MGLIMRKFNLSLDDMSPHPNAGLGFESIKWCDKLIIKYPDIKIDLFVPARYARLGQKSYNLVDHPDWVAQLNSLPTNYRINLHGFYHRRSKKDFAWHDAPKSNNNEWERLTFRQAECIMSKTERDFRRAGVVYERVFRPPGWHIGRAAVQFLTDQGFVIAGNDRYYKMHASVKNIKWVSCSWDLIEPAPNAGKDIYAFGHTSDWTNNYMNEERFNKINKLLESEGFKFVFISAGANK